MQSQYNTPITVCYFAFHDIPSFQLSPTSLAFIFKSHDLVQFT